MRTLKVLKNKLRYLNYSERTIETYLCYLSKFFEEENIRDPYQVTTVRIVYYLENKRFTSISQQNQIIGALKLFARLILNKKNIHLNKIQRPRNEKKLPKVIDAELLALKIKAIENLKHKSILALGLSCGLRISEVINLKWEHLDRKRNLLKVVNGKGNKDRFCILNDDMIKLMEKYWRKHRSKEYVFNGQKRLQYSSTSIQNITKRYIHQRASFHILRHSYSTYAIDNGTELKPLSVSLGHNSTKTVEQYYFHQSTRTLKTIKQAM
jgi:integrase